MELLPDLADRQKEFALRYFPIFEYFKTAVLLTAGIALLVNQENEPSPDLHKDLERTAQQAKSAIHQWDHYQYPDELDLEYFMVRDVLQMVANALDGFQRALFQAPPDTLSAYTQNLLAAYTQMRNIALSYWRLDLVPESAIHTH